MRKTVRVFSEVAPRERLGRAIVQLPPSAQQALDHVAGRVDLPLMAGSWSDGSGGCLVANVVAAYEGRPEDRHATLDLRALDLLPELSSRDLNRLIVAWDEAAAQLGRPADPALRQLLRDALAWAGVAGYRRCVGAAPSTTSTSSSSPSLMILTTASSPGR